MREITISLTPDELGNVTQALENYLDHLSDYGEKDYDPEDDVEEIAESARNALSKINAAGYDALTSDSRNCSAGEPERI